MFSMVGWRRQVQVLIFENLGGARNWTCWGTASLLALAGSKCVTQPRGRQQESAVHLLPNGESAIAMQICRTCVEQVCNAERWEFQ